MEPELKLGNLPEVTAVNKAVRDNYLRISSEKHNAAADNWLAKIASVDNPTYHYLGKFGQALSSFANVVDIQHPLIAQIQDGAFARNSSIGQEVYESLLLAKSIQDLKLTLVGDKFKETFLANAKHQKLLKAMLKPPASVVANTRARNFIRETANPKEIDLKAALNDQGEQKRGDVNANAMEVWESAFNTLMPYVRLGEGFKSIIEANNKLSEKLQILGLDKQVAAIASDNLELTKTPQDTFYGFVRIWMKEVALILAKIHNFTMQSDSRLVVPKSYFKDPFWDQTTEKKDPLLKQPSNSAQHFVYGARAYPLTKFPAPVTPYVQEIITGLESHPEADRKPIFDQYWVIVPTVVLLPQSDQYVLRFGERTETYQDYWEAHKGLDAYLVGSQIVTAAIVGESAIQHKCYFICYWT